MSVGDQEKHMLSGVHHGGGAKRLQHHLLAKNTVEEKEGEKKRGREEKFDRSRQKR